MYPEDKQIRQLWASEVMRVHDKTDTAFLITQKEYEGYYWYETEEDNY